MQRSKKPLFLVIIALVLVVATAIGLSRKSSPASSSNTAQSVVTFTKVAGGSSSDTKEPSAITTEQASTVINRALSSVGTNGIAYTVAEQSRPAAGWVVFTITYPGFPDAREQVIAKQDSSGTLTYVTGPASPFKLDALQKANVPEAVIKSVNYEEDEL